MKKYPSRKNFTLQRQRFKRKNQEPDPRTTRNADPQRGHGPKKSKQEEFDLLGSDIFKVVFDYYIPRPHFMIFPREGVQLEGPDYSNLNNKSKQELVRVAKAFIHERNLKPVSILSIHRGGWIDKLDEFHAHIPSKPGEYISVFEQKEHEKPKWPPKSYAGNNPKKYKASVKSYKGKSWFKDDVKSIYEMIEKKKTVKETTKTSGTKNIDIKEKPKNKEKVNEAPKTLKTCDGHTLLLHPSKPRVGFVREKTSKYDDFKLLDVMDEFATQNGMTERNKKPGCHLCLVLRNDDNQQHGFEIHEDQKLCGYIETSAPKFYDSFLPEEKKNEWFQKFTEPGDYRVFT